MTPSETAKLLAKAALIDNRSIDRETNQAWHEAIGHIDYRDALLALTMHRQRSTEYLQPAHILRLAAEARRERELGEARERARHALPPAAPKGMPRWFRDFLDNAGKEKPTGGAA